MTSVLTREKRKEEKTTNKQKNPNIFYVKLFSVIAICNLPPTFIIQAPAVKIKRDNINRTS